MSGPTKSVRFREAIRMGMVEEMERDDRVYIVGEEVGHYQGAYKVTEGMLEKFGPSVSSTRRSPRAASPASRSAPPWLGCGPIVEYMTWNFSAVAFDQILNNAAKLRQMSGGQLHVPHRLPRRPTPRPSRSAHSTPTRWSTSTRTCRA
jgi:pyruvate dehydrogenase E1 component beta subunit